MAFGNIQCPDGDCLHGIEPGLLFVFVLGMGAPIKRTGDSVTVEIQHQGYFRNVPVVETKGIGPCSPGPFFQMPIAFTEAVKKKFALGGGLVRSFLLSEQSSDYMPKLSIAFPP